MSGQSAPRTSGLDQSDEGAQIGGQGTDPAAWKEVQNIVRLTLV